MVICHYDPRSPDCERRRSSEILCSWSLKDMLCSHCWWVHPPVDMALLTVSCKQSNALCDCLHGMLVTACGPPAEPLMQWAGTWCRPDLCNQWGRLGRSRPSSRVGTHSCHVSFRSVSVSLSLSLSVSLSLSLFLSLSLSLYIYIYISLSLSRLSLSLSLFYLSLSLSLSLFSLSLSLSIYIYIFMYKYIYIYIYLSLSLYLSFCMCIYIYIFLYIYIHTSSLDSVLTKWGLLWIHDFWRRAVFILRK